jgi:D-3-phosphoglycerate dehydrogenase
MYNVKLYNKISKVGLDDLDPAKYTCSEDFTDYDAVLVRSAKLHDVEFPKNLRCIARAGAGVNNIPIDRCSEEGIVVFNTPGANANAVKELVICALLLASRKVVQGANWVKSLKGTPDIGPAAEKGKSTYAGPEIAGKKLGGSVKFLTAVRYQTGEGIEKKEENFAAEVAAQMNQGK